MFADQSCQISCFKLSVLLKLTWGAWLREVSAVWTRLPLQHEWVGAVKLFL